MVDRAKRGYVNVRNKELEIEMNSKLSEEKKKELIDFLKAEKDWAVKALDQEVNEFNQLSSLGDKNFVRGFLIFSKFS
jgi:hypothetical protein